MIKLLAGVRKVSFGFQEMGCRLVHDAEAV